MNLATFIPIKPPIRFASLRGDGASAYCRAILAASVPDRPMSDRPRELVTRLFHESRDALGRYIRRLVRSRETAEEIVQEAFLRTYEQGGAVEVPRAFLFSTARNLATDRRRHERAAATDSVADFDDVDIPAGGVSPESALIADEASRLLKKAIDRLPPQCHAALTLKVFQGYTHKEIGAALGISERTVEKHIALGLARTHEYLRSRYSQQRRERQDGRDDAR